MLHRFLAEPFVKPGPIFLVAAFVRLNLRTSTDCLVPCNVFEYDFELSSRFFSEELGFTRIRQLGAFRRTTELFSMPVFFELG